MAMVTGERELARAALFVEAAAALAIVRSTRARISDTHAKIFAKHTLHVKPGGTPCKGVRMSTAIRQLAPPKSTPFEDSGRATHQLDPADAAEYFTAVGVKHDGLNRCLSRAARSWPRA